MAVELDPKSAFAYDARGSVYRAKGAWAEALADFDKAIELDPKYAFAYSERGEIHRATQPWNRQQRFQLRRERQPLRGERVVERLDAEPISGQKEATAPAVPDGEGEHAVESLDASLPPLVVGMDDDLGIGVGVETMACVIKPFTQFGEVVDLSVEDDPGGFPLVVNRLVAADRVDDGQAADAESHAIAQQDTLVVGTPMDKGVAHSGQ